MSLLWGEAEAIHHKHRVHARQGHRLRMRGDDDPPPEVPGGESDPRYKSHWRKPWPEGHDNSDGDADILARFNKPDPRKIKVKKEEKYPWEYDKDVIDTKNSIEKGEEIKKDKLSIDSVAVTRGRDWIFQFNDGKHKGRGKPPKEGVAGWDHTNEYTGDW